MRRRVLGVLAFLMAVGVLRVALWRPFSVAGPLPDDGFVRVGGVVHVHTTLSDGGGTPEEVVAEARRAGLSFVALTDHNHLDAKPLEGYRDGVLVVVGTEVSTSAGHLLGLGLPDPVYRFSDDPTDALSDVRDAGGVAFAAHPVSPRPDFRWTGWDAARCLGDGGRERRQPVARGGLGAAPLDRGALRPERALRAPREPDAPDRGPRAVGHAAGAAGCGGDCRRRRPQPCAAHEAPVGPLSVVRFGLRPGAEPRPPRASALGRRRSGRRRASRRPSAGGAATWASTRWLRPAASSSWRSRASAARRWGTRLPSLRG